VSWRYSKMLRIIEEKMEEKKEKEQRRRYQ
jgi:hypothetical protein